MPRPLRTTLALTLSMTISGSASAHALPNLASLASLRTLDAPAKDSKKSTASGKQGNKAGAAQAGGKSGKGSAKTQRPRKPYPEIEHVDPESLDDDARVERAKKFYIEAENFAEKKEWEEAIVRYEEAYRMVPEKHGFAYKVGVAAWAIRDCLLAKEYLEHLLSYGSDQDKLADKVAEAESIIAEIEKSGCAEEAEAAAAVVEENPLELEESPLVAGSADEAAEASDEPKNKMKIGAWALIGTGVVGLGGGVATLIVAKSTATELETLTGNSTTPPIGDYACRDDEAPCPYTLEKRLTGMNILTPVALSVGVAALGTGVVLLILDAKSAGKSSEKDSVAATVGPMWLPRGGGATATLRF